MLRFRMRCFFVSDLHGHGDRYQALFERMEAEAPDIVFLGGDLLPHRCDRQRAQGGLDFLSDYLLAQLARLRERLADGYPRILVILGNDDPRAMEQDVVDASTRGLWTYVHELKVAVGDVVVYGYSYVPPTPFIRKDWERYDVSRYVDPGAVSPEEGMRTIPVSANEIRYATIERDLARLAGGDDLSRAIFLFHAPPYKTALDRAALDGRFVDHVPVDPHVGSVAIRRFIEQRQPWLTLHGHIHESAELTGSWRDRIGRTQMFSAAHRGSGLALVRFSTDDLDSAVREVVYPAKATGGH